MLNRLSSWCKKAKFKPGLVDGGGAPPYPSRSPAALGGFKNSRLWASNVVDFVGWMVTLEVLEEVRLDL